MYVDGTLICEGGVVDAPRPLDTENLLLGEGPPSGDVLRRLHQEALRLETVTQNLVEPSRAGAPDARRESLDLESVVVDAYDRFQPLVVERSLSVTMDARPAPVRADEHLLDQALNNLIAAALRATRQGGISLRCGVAGDRAFVEVADTGPGMPDGAREGLGLCVMRDVGRTLGGSFGIVNDRGARARSWLPADGPGAVGET